MVRNSQSVPGIRAITESGHTGGHTRYGFESKGQKLVVWGDLTEIAWVQFAEPDVTKGFDNDAPESARERVMRFAQTHHFFYEDPP